jgi:hypothetical protein
VAAFSSTKRVSGSAGTVLPSGWCDTDWKQSTNIKLLSTTLEADILSLYS